MQACLLISLQILLVVTTNVVGASQDCGLCPAGLFLNGCKNSTIPNCTPCSADSFKPGLNSLTQCTRCTSCHRRNNVEVRRCNGTHDSECRCKAGYWYDTGALYCARCSGCRRGKGVVANCSLTADIKCNRCVRGVTFSPLNSETEPCRPCTQCGENEEKVELCTRRKDTECKPIPVKKEFQLKNKSKWPDKNNKNSTLQPTTSEKETLPQQTTSTTTEQTTQPTTVLMDALKKDESNARGHTALELILIVAGSILGCLLLVFLVFIIVRHRRKTTHPETTRTQVISAPSPYQTHKECKTIDNRLSNMPLMHGSTDKLLRDVTYSLIDELSRHLNPKGRWKTLAGKLDFSNTDIQNFELEPTNATSTMLSHWGQLKDSTLHNLYDALRSLKWSVEAGVVAKYL